MSDDIVMEQIHRYRLDSVQHLLYAIRDINRLVSFEAALLFNGEENFAITINCELH